MTPRRFGDAILTAEGLRIVQSWKNRHTLRWVTKFTMGFIAYDTTKHGTLLALKVHGQLDQLTIAQICFRTLRGTDFHEDGNSYRRTAAINTSFIQS